MHGTMGGYYEIRVTGPGRRQYRLFCRLDNGTTEELENRGFDRPVIAVITGMSKPHRQVFSDAEYRRHVRALGEDYVSTQPRPIKSRG
jgi:hypothetical protein